MDQFLKSLCEANNFRAVTLTIHPSHSEPFTVFVHTQARECGSGDGMTVEDAVDEAITDLRRRFPEPATKDEVA